MKPLGLIVAIANNGVIGTETNELPWHYPEDMKHFKRTTRGHPIIVGRKTYESLPEKFRPLPGRHNIVMSQTVESSEIVYSKDNTALEFVRDVPEALTAATLIHGDKMPIVIGGAQIYNLFMPYVTRLWVTHIHKDYDGSVKLEIDYSRFNKVEATCFEEFEIAIYDLKVPH